MEDSQYNRQKIERAEIKVTGRVQGVFFRHAAKLHADKFGLWGFVRNEPDGSVFIVAEGEETALQKLVEWAKLGTKEAYVDHVDVSWVPAANEFTEFKII